MAHFTLRGLSIKREKLETTVCEFWKVGLSFSSSVTAIRVNLLNPYASLFLYDLLLSLWCFSILVSYYFQVFFNLKVIFSVAKITQNTATELLYLWICQWILNNLQLTHATNNHISGVESFACNRPVWSELHSSFPTTGCDSEGHHVTAVSIKDVWWSQVLWPSRGLATHVRDLDVIIR